MKNDIQKWYEKIDASNILVLLLISLLISLPFYFSHTNQIEILKWAVIAVSIAIVATQVGKIESFSIAGNNFKLKEALKEANATIDQLHGVTKQVTQFMFSSIACGTQRWIEEDDYLNITNKINQKNQIIKEFKNIGLKICDSGDEFFDFDKWIIIDLSEIVCRSFNNIYETIISEQTAINGTVLTIYIFNNSKNFASERFSKCLNDYLKYCNSIKLKNDDFINSIKELKIFLEELEKTDESNYNFETNNPIKSFERIENIIKSYIEEFKSQNEKLKGMMTFAEFIYDFSAFSNSLEKFRKYYKLLDCDDAEFIKARDALEFYLEHKELPEDCIDE